MCLLGSRVAYKDEIQPSKFRQMPAHKIRCFTHKLFFYEKSGATRETQNVPQMPSDAAE